MTDKKYLEKLFNIAIYADILFGILRYIRVKKRSDEE